VIRAILRAIDALWRFSWEVSRWRAASDAFDRAVDRTSPPLDTP
jgi:hypothetical protein